MFFILTCKRTNTQGRETLGESNDDTTLRLGSPILNKQTFLTSICSRTPTSATYYPHTNYMSLAANLPKRIEQALMKSSGEVQEAPRKRSEGFLWRLSTPQNRNSLLAASQKAPRKHPPMTTRRPTDDQPARSPPSVHDPLATR